MKIILLSDTHGFLDDRIIAYCQNADEIWHAGDIGTISVAETLEKIKPLRAVYGNIDGREIRQQFPLDNRFLINGISVWMTHIGGYPGRYDQRVRNILNQNSPDLFICGHSHILKVMRDQKFNMLMMNPGAAGISGFHKMRTMLRFEINDSKINNVEVIELGKRATIQ